MTEKFVRYGEGDQVSIILTDYMFWSANEKALDEWWAMENARAYEEAERETYY